MSEDSLFALGEVRREREIPIDVEVALEHTAPQALLRDLHRPVSTFEVPSYEFERQPFIRTRAGTAETAELRATALASYQVPICDLIRTSATMHEEHRALRAILRRPWADAPKLGSQRATGAALGYFKDK